VCIKCRLSSNNASHKPECNFGENKGGRNCEGYNIEADVLIVGCGPAGIFAAIELSERKDLNVLMLDQGPDIYGRSCPASREVGCTKTCLPCPRSCGWGGAGAFSDGKLHISSSVGGWLTEYRSEEELARLSRYVDSVFLRFGAPHKLYGTSSSKVAEIQRMASLAELQLIPTKLRHLGTDRCVATLVKIKKHIESAGVQVRTRTRAERLLVEEGEVKGIQTYDNRKIISKCVIVAPGRSGSPWLTNQLASFGLSSEQNPVDLGLRVEVPAVVMEHLTTVLFEPKLLYFSKKFDDKVRMFCVCPYGEVITELNRIEGKKFLTVNGQGFSRPITKNTNFAILVNTKFTTPFYEPQTYAKNIAELADLLSKGVVVQRLGDLERGRRSTKERVERTTVNPSLKAAKPGDLSFVLPYRYLTDILEMLQAIDKIAPGVYSDGNLLYGLEAKFYSSRPKLSRDFETMIPNLYAIGDGAGISRGLFQAAISGVIAARSVLERIR